MERKHMLFCDLWHVQEEGSRARIHILSSETSSTKAPDNIRDPFIDMPIDLFKKTLDSGLPWQSIG